MSEGKGTEVLAIKQTALTAKTLLGCDGGSLIKLMPDGTVKSVLKKVKLYENQKHFYYEKQAGHYLITLEGYKELVKFTDVKVLKIDTMVTDGKHVNNPYYETDSTGKLVKVVEEVTVYGRTPQGEIAFSRARVIADINAMLSKKLIKAAEYDATLGEFCDYENYKEMRKTKSVFFFPVTEQVIMGETIVMGVAIDMKNKKAFELIRKHMDEIEHEYKKVGAKAYRNAVKSHPAIGKYVINPNGPEGNKVAEITIIQWTTDLTAAEIEQIESYKSTGITNAPDYVVQSDEELKDVTELEPEEFEELEEVQEESNNEPVTDEKQTLINYITESKFNVGYSIFNSAMDKFGVTDLNECEIIVLKSIKSEINTQFDLEMGEANE
jgi:hypothetical protein